MGLINKTHKEYYQGNKFGGYQFTSLDDIITQFQIAYVGEDKIIPKIKRADIAFHAQRALQELSFDTFKSTKSYQIDVPSNLVMKLPHDYVNYTKLTWVDSAGIKHPLYPTNRTSNPFQIRQDDNGEYSFPEGVELLINNDFESAFGEPWYTSTEFSAFGANYSTGFGIDSGVLKFSYITKASGAGATNWGYVHAVYQEIDTSNLLYLDISADGTAQTITEGIGTIRFGLTTSIPSDNSRNNIGTTAPIAYPISPNVDPEIFDLVTTDGNNSYVEWVGPTSVGSTTSTNGISDGVDGKALLAIDVSAHDKVYAVVVSYVDFTTGLTYGEHEKVNYIDDLSVTDGLASVNLQAASGNERESSTWNSYKSGTSSSNGVDNSLNTNPAVDVDNYFQNTGQRYGLDPQYAQANGSFFIDDRLGRIHFSSNISGKTIILDYISDSLGTDEEMQVHKFAEEAMYKSILCAIMSAKANVGRNQLMYYKKDKFAAIRQAKLRLSNIKLEELTQTLRGKSKHIKH